MLPDSNVNEAASHGFIKFKVDQQPDLDLETKIYNSAAIYFDYNAPVITNKTMHTIGESFFTVSTHQVTKPLAKVEITPNPFLESTSITVEGVEIKNGVFNLYDAMGRVLRSEYLDSNTFSFNREQLQSGIYFFTVKEKGTLVASGKLVLQ